MKWPEFVERFPGVEPSTIRYHDGDGFGPVMFCVRHGGRVIETLDEPNVLAAIAEKLEID